MFAATAGAQLMPGPDFKPLPASDSAAPRRGDWSVLIGDKRFGPWEGDGLPVGISTDAARYRIASGRDLSPELLPHVVASYKGRHLLYFPSTIPAFARPAGHEDHALCRQFDGTLIPVNGHTELSTLLHMPTVSRGDRSVAGQSYVDALNAARFLSDIQTLASFGKRNTFAASNATARDWIASEMTDAGLTVTKPQFTVSATTAYNVVGKLTGSATPDDFIVVGAHYDSLPGSSSSSPGAEDNGSGTAAVLEMARAFGPQGSQLSIYFIAFGGEEQGLYGSTAWASALTAQQRTHLKGAIIMDMIGYSADSRMDVLLETSPFASPVRDVMASAAADFTNLTVFSSDNPFGSDHVPFLNRNMPAVLAIENDWDVYPQYHKSGDTYALITPAQGEGILRMNTGALARLANPLTTSVESWYCF